VTLSRRVVWATFAVAVALAMGLSIRNGFVYDDIPAIVRNPRVTDPGQWHTIYHSPYWLGTLWRPFTVAMYAVQWLFGHGGAWAFHLLSMVVYFAVAVLVFQLLVSLDVSKASAFAGAAAGVTLWLVHPVHVEVVANVVGQAELWAALWMVSATVIYVKARKQHTERRAFLPLLVVAALAIMSKEQGFVLPLPLGGAEWLLFADRGEALRTRVRLLVPVTALAVLLFVIRGILLDSYTGETPAVALRALSPLGRTVTFLGVIPEWARLMVWPWHLQADYGPPGIPVGGPITLRHLIGAVLLIGFVVLFFRWRKQNPAGAFGLYFMAVTLAPVSNLLTPTGIVMAERVLFLPTIGLVMVLAGIEWRANRLGARGWGLMLSVVAIAFTVRSATRVPTFSTQERFFSDITIDGADAYRGWKVSAEYWDQVGDRSRAVAELKHSIELWPHDYEVAERLGQMYRQDGHCDEAVPVFARGLAADSSATSLRAKLIECLIVVKDFDRAERVAQDGVALGGTEFQGMVERVRKVRGSGPGASLK